MGRPAQQLTKTVTDYLTAQNVFWWRNSGGGVRVGTPSGIPRFVRFGQPGVSDLCALSRGRFFAIEIKAGRDQLRDSQRQFKQNVEAHGGIFVECRGLDDVRRALVGEWLE